MCWVTYRNEPKAALAQVDIPVYKVVKKYYQNELFPELDNKVYSQFSKFEYELGKEYDTQIGRIRHPETDIEKLFYPNSAFLIDEGFHSYYHRINDICSNRLGDCCTKYEIEFSHCCGDIVYQFDESPSKCYLAECRIPAGSNWYLSAEGLYVSDRIVIDKLLDIEETYQVFKSIGEIRRAHNL